MGGRARQLGDPYCRARRPRLFEVRCVDRVHSGEQLHIGQVDVHCDRVTKPHVSFFQHQADILQALLDLRLEIIGIFSGLHVLARLAGDVERAIGEDAGAEWTSGRELFRLDHFLLGQERQGKEQANC